MSALLTLNLKVTLNLGRGAEPDSRARRWTTTDRNLKQARAQVLNVSGGGERTEPLGRPCVCSDVLTRHVVGHVADAMQVVDVPSVRRIPSVVRRKLGRNVTAM